MAIHPSTPCEVSLRAVPPPPRFIHPSLYRLSDVVHLKIDLSILLVVEPQRHYREHGPQVRFCARGQGLSVTAQRIREEGSL